MPTWLDPWPLHVNVNVNVPLLIGRYTPKPDSCSAYNTGTYAQKPAMQVLRGSLPVGGQQSALEAQRSSRLEHMVFIGEQVPFTSLNSPTGSVV